ncbi:hypothetical protein [Priestia megaterium]|uniref:hypothetical protein n=1 Tax=Priestia megaterium TaxID=1404 RepID=UPI003CC6835B
MNKITILFLVDNNHLKQKDKAKLMIQSLINKNDTSIYKETKEEIYLETETHQIKILTLSQSPRGHKANFIIDLSGNKEAIEAAHNNSTYDWNITQSIVKNNIKSNNWH